MASAAGVSGGVFPSTVFRVLSSLVMDQTPVRSGLAARHRPGRASNANIPRACLTTSDPLRTPGAVAELVHLHVELVEDAQQQVARGHRAARKGDVAIAL